MGQGNLGYTYLLRGQAHWLDGEERKKEGREEGETHANHLTDLATPFFFTPPTPLLFPPLALAYVSLAGFGFWVGEEKKDDISRLY